MDSSSGHGDTPARLAPTPEQRRARRNRAMDIVSSFPGSYVLTGSSAMRAITGMGVAALLRVSEPFLAHNPLADDIPESQHSVPSTSIVHLCFPLRHESQNVLLIISERVV